MGLAGTNTTVLPALPPLHSFVPFNDALTSTLLARAQITDRYAQSMSQSELVRWNDRVARLEAEINAEKERR